MTTAPGTADPSTSDATSRRHRTDAGGEKPNAEIPVAPRRSDEPGHSTSSALTKHEVPQSISVSFDTRDALPQRLIRGTLATCKCIRPSFFQAKGVARTKVRPVFYTAEPTWLCIASKHTANLTKVCWNRSELTWIATDLGRSPNALSVIGIDTPTTQRQARYPGFCSGRCRGSGRARRCGTPHSVGIGPLSDPLGSTPVRVRPLAARPPFTEQSQRAPNWRRTGSSGAVILPEKSHRPKGWNHAQVIRRHCRTSH